MSMTVQLPDEVTADLARRAQLAGQSESEFVADSVRRRLAIERFRERRERLKDYGRAAGLTHDEAVFDTVS